MAAPHNATRANYVQFRGLQDARGLDGVEFGGFIESENTDISRDGKPQRRPGRTQVYNGEVRDVWGDGERLLFVTGTGELRELEDDESTTVIKSGLPGTGRLSAIRNANTIYWSYGNDQGVIENRINRQFGLDQLMPAGVVVSTSSQRLQAGRYRYAWVALTSTGEEGPIGLRGSFELSDRAGVELVPPIPTDPQALRVRAYVTEANGTQLYRLGDVLSPTDAGEQAARQLEVTPLLDAIRPHREDLQTLPPFIASGLHNGRLIVGYDDLILYSERFDYEYFAPDEMFIPLPSRVKVIAPVEGGVFVGTEKDHYFLRGNDIAQAELDHKANYGAVANTVDYLEQKEHGFDVSGRIAVWTGARGPVFGLPGGQMEDTGDGVVAVPSDAVYGAGAVRKYAGDTHYVSVIRYRG
jgi:hypothetical protein